MEDENRSKKNLFNGLMRLSKKYIDNTGLESRLNLLLNRWMQLRERSENHIPGHEIKIGNIVEFNDFFLKIFEISPIAMCISTLEDGRIIDVNRSLLKLIGYKRKETIGRMTFEVGLIPEKDRKKALSEFTRKGRLRNYAFKFQSKEGKVIDVLWSADLIMIENQKCLISSVLDNTERNLAEKKVKQYTERLRILLDLNRAILELRSPQKIAKAALEQIIKLMPCQRTSVTLLDLKRGEIEFIAVKAKKGYKFKTANRFTVKPFEKYLKVIKNNKVLLTQEISKGPQASKLAQVLYKRGLRSSVTVPLIFRGEIIGTLNLYSKRLHFFSQEYIDIALDVADPLAIAIQQSRLYERLSEGSDRLSALSRQLVETQEKERHHIAQEFLHDGVGQELTALRFILYNLWRTNGASNVRGRLRESLDILDNVIKEVRDLSIDLRPPIINDFGLAPTLEWLLNRHAERTGAQVHFRADLPEKQIPKELETTCFRVVQEALTNAARHAGAKHIDVQLQQNDNNLLLMIYDDGVGFKVREALRRYKLNGNMGLMGMQERVRLIGGELEIKSAPRQGTHIEARFPLPDIN